jgi:hypothetical protein
MHIAMGLAKRPLGFDILRVKVASTTISASAGTIISMVLHFTIGIGSPAKPPATPISSTP